MKEIDFNTYDFPSNEKGDVDKKKLIDIDDLHGYVLHLVESIFKAKITDNKTTISVDFGANKYNIKIEEI